MELRTMISLTLRVRCIVAIAAALVPISWAFGQAPGTGGGDRNYPALTYRSPSNIENILDVVTIRGKTYLVGRQFDGKLNGMMQRVFADGTVQFEEWESGTLLQVGLRGPFSSTIAPQTQARGAPATRSGAPETGAVAPAAIDLNGAWVGKSSGNRVTIQVRSDGIFVAPVTTNAGQSTQGFLYRGSGTTYRVGQDSVVQVLGPNQIRVTNRDGWTDVFGR